MSWLLAKETVIEDSPGIVKKKSRGKVPVREPPEMSMMTWQPEVLNIFPPGKNAVGIVPLRPTEFVSLRENDNILADESGVNSAGGIEPSMRLSAN